MREILVYRTASGLIFRVSGGGEGEGYLSVETLGKNGWMKAQTGVLGLRVNPTTRQLTAKQILALPS
jgi:hypothetical protein